VTEAGERLYSRERTVATRGGEVQQGIRKTLEIRQGYGGQRLAGVRAEPPDIGGIGALGVKEAAVKPDLDQLGIGMGLLGGGQHGEWSEDGGFMVADLRAVGGGAGRPPQVPGATMGM
jgi:hypothetical protein